MLGVHEELEFWDFIYDLIYKASAEAMLEMARDPEYLGAKIGFLCVPRVKKIDQRIGSIWKPLTAALGDRLLSRRELTDATWFISKVQIV